MVDETTPGDEPPAPKYDQEFFLDLASKGKDAWNAWRRDPANKDVRVTFAGVDFSEAPRDGIDFSGFEFGDHADFSQCKWRGVEWQEIKTDTKAFAGGRAFFAYATFGDYATFAGAAFSDAATFTGAAFGRGAEFTAAAFGNDATFTGAAFDGWTQFTDAAFGDDATFTGAAFGGRAWFSGAAFGRKADFKNALFNGRAEFTGKSDVTERENRSKESLTRHGSRPNRFLTISFSNARFNGEARFSDRSFAQRADFTGTRFCYPPDFDAATNLTRIDFTGARISFAFPGEFHWTEDTKVPVRLRALRKIAEDTKNHDLERDLYVEERKAERGVYWRQLLDELKNSPEELKKKLEDIDEQQREVWSNWRHRARARNAHRLGIAVRIGRLAVHGFWIFVMGGYWALADYGRSLVRPFVCWLVLSLIIFPWMYGQILPVPQKANSLDVDKYEQAVQMVARANAVPFVGPLTIDSDIKKFLFCFNTKDCHPIPPEGYQLLVLSQNLFSIILVFFIGLALRNYFRIK